MTRGLTLRTTGAANNFEEAPADTHAGICIAVIDLGDQLDRQNSKWVHKVRIDFELPFTSMTDGRPFMVSQEWTASLGDRANLRKVLESWRGKSWPKEGPGEDFSLKNLLGKAAMVQVVHTPKKNGDGVWVNINNLMPIPRHPQTKQPMFEMPATTHNQQRFLELTQEGFNAEVFDSLSDKTRSRIANSRTFMDLFPGGLWAKGQKAPLPVDPATHQEEELPPQEHDWGGDPHYSEDDIPF